MRETFRIPLLESAAHLPEPLEILERFRQLVLGDAWTPLGGALEPEPEPDSGPARARIVVDRGEYRPDPEAIAAVEHTETLELARGGPEWDASQSAWTSKARTDPGADSEETPEERARIVIDRRSYRPDRAQVAQVERTETLIFPRDMKARLSEIEVRDPREDEDEGEDAGDHSDRRDPE